MLYYAPVILQQVGYESDQSATLATVWAGVTKVCDLSIRNFVMLVLTATKTGYIKSVLPTDSGIYSGL